MLKKMSPVAPCPLAVVARVARTWLLSSSGPHSALPAAARLELCPGHMWRPFTFSPIHQSSSTG